MNLDLEWEVGVFKAAEAGYKKLFGKPAISQPHAARLDDHKGALTLVARALTGEPIEIKPAESAGGSQGFVIYLPPVIDVFSSTEANRRLYLFRTVMHAKAKPTALPLDPRDLPVVESLAGFRNVMRTAKAYPTFQDIAVSYAEAVLGSRGKLAPIQTYFLRAIALSDCGRIRHWLDASFDEALGLIPDEAKQPAPKKQRYTPLLLWGRLYAQPAIDKSMAAGDAPQGSLPAGTELAAPPKEDVTVIRVDEEAWKKKASGPQFEKVESAEDFTGNMRPFDGKDELEEQEEAMKDLQLKHVIRSRHETRAIFKADLQLDNGAGEAADDEQKPGGVTYSEWDAARKTYRPAWCTVYPERARKTDAAFVQKSLTAHRTVQRALEEQLAKLRSEYRAQPRQTDGAEIDIDALVENAALLAAGRTPGDRLYIRAVRRERDIALLILMDLSLSTDSYVKGLRILDVAKESLLVFGEVWSKEQNDFGVAGFSSNTRHSCRYLEIKSFHEPWAQARSKIGALEPEGYTRIGPALRHATSVLAKQAAPKKALMLITDGRPNDYDRYEGRHGIADVKMAVKEARNNGVGVHALAIDHTAKEYFPAMLASGSFRVLPRPGLLPDALAQFFTQLQK